jgi:hypothetical protein
MTDKDLSHPPCKDDIPPSPYPFLLAGLLAEVLAAGLRLANGESNSSVLLLGMHGVLLAAGLLLAGVSVILRPRSPLVLAAAAASAGLADLALDPSWDSIRLLLRAAMLVAGVCAGLVLLPRRLARIAVSLLVVFHFAGILTAVTSVPPPGGPPPWLPSQAATYVFRPYLQFMYLTNAYHFYSPEPGPACLLWCYVEYSDGSSRWVKLPNRQEHLKDPMALSYYRRLALTEATNQLLGPVVPSQDAIARRLIAGQRLGIPAPNEINEALPGAQQYRVPNDHSCRVLRGYARFLAHAYPHESSEVEVAGVKIYRVIHMMLDPKDVVAGASPTDPALFVPYFQGEFDREGNLKQPNDPFLYWLVPILKMRRLGSATEEDANAIEVRDYVEIHARSLSR